MTTTYRCAVIGNPIAHSKSPQIHAKFAQDYEISLQYDRILAQEETFVQIVKYFFQNGGRGLNITLPFKELAFQLADNLSPEALAAGAVNTLSIKNGCLYGENTDGLGLMNALKNVHNFNLQNKKVLLLGAGGAARGVILPLLKNGIASLKIANRTFSRALELEKHFNNPKISASAWENIPAENFNLIINATSSGIDNSEINLPKNLHCDLAYEMVYGKKTPFLHWAENHAKTSFTGESMLIEQAKLSFLSWFGEIIDARKN